MEENLLNTLTGTSGNTENHTQKEDFDMAESLVDTEIPTKLLDQHYHTGECLVKGTRKRSKNIP